MNLPRDRETRLVWELCIVAALRVLIFSAAFPFFGNVDEAQHFDVVIKYSLGHAPRRLDLIAPESARYIAFYGSPEFLSEAKDFPNGQYPPTFWTQPSEDKKFVSAHHGDGQAVRPATDI